MPISAARVLKAVFVSLVLAFSAYSVAKLNLFGLETSSDRVADGVYQRITAADYGAARKGQRSVSIIALDDSSLQAMKGYGWTRFPPTYDQQWTMLDDLMNVGGAPPSAIYVDFVYMSEGAAGEGFDTFVKGVASATHAAAWASKPTCLTDPVVKLACIVAASGTPIIFAKPSPTDLDDFPDAERALDGVSVMATALVGQTAYPMVTTYALAPAAASRLGVHGFDISPAVALYVADCLRRNDGCGARAILDARERGRLAMLGKPSSPSDFGRTFEAPMDVVWGSRPDPDYLAMTHKVSGLAAPCRGTGAGWGARLAEQMVGLRGPGSGRAQECPYTLTLNYDRIVAGRGLEQKDLARVLAGKMVLVGGQFHASSDWVESPVQGQVPGVQYHAMALDNLVEDGLDYRRNASATFDSDLLKSLLLAALAFCGIMAVMVRNSLVDHTMATRGHGRLHPKVYGPLYVGLFTTSIGVVILATWLGVTFAHRSPINWIGISACVLGFLFYATRQTLPADVIGSIEHLPLARRLIAAANLWRAAMKFEEDRLLRRPVIAAGPPSPPRQASTSEKASVHAEI